MGNIYLDNADKQQLILKKHFSKGYSFDQLYKLYKGKINLDAASEFEIDLLENELLNINNFNSENIDSDILENAKEFYNKLINKIALSNDIEDCLILIDNKFLSQFNSGDKDTLDKIKNKYKNYRDNAEKLGRKYLAGKELSESEYKILFCNSLRYAPELRDEVFKKFITSNNSQILNLYEIKFICDYINDSQASELNYDSCGIYLGEYMPYLDKSTGEIKKKLYATVSNAGAASESGIMINTRNLGLGRYNTIDSLIAIISHESMHMKQHNDFFKGNFTLENMVTIEGKLFYASYGSYDVYKVNYDFHESEFQANYHSYIKLLELSEEYDVKYDVSKTQQKLNKLMVNHAYSMIIPNPQKNDSMVWMLDEYRPRFMELLFIKYPSLLNKKEYSIYNYFFNKNGQLKTIYDMAEKIYSFKGPKQRKEEIQQIYIPFLTYAFEKEKNILGSESVINAVELLKNYEESQLKLMEEGRETFRDNIKHHLKLVDKRFLNTDDMLIQKRKIKLAKYRSFLLKNNINDNSTNNIESYDRNK